MSILERDRALRFAPIKHLLWFLNFSEIPNAAIRNGPEPLGARLNSAAEEWYYYAALIETWHRGGTAPMNS